MSDEKPPPTYEQLVEATMVAILEEGIIERAEARIRGSSEIARDEIDDLIGDAQMKLISNAPESLRSSFETVISWHRWNAIYKAAMKKGQTTTAMDAMRQIDKLMGSIH